MKQVAKVLIRNEQQEFLLLRLNNHPIFGNDPDLPGGTVDSGETPKMAAIREVYEEVGIILNEAEVVLRMQDTMRSKDGTAYYLYEARAGVVSDVILSWEHESYQWVSSEELVKFAEGASDSYMHMVCDAVRTTELKLSA